MQNEIGLGGAPVAQPRKVQALVRGAVLVLAGTVVITIASKVQVPFYPVPMTLQTLAVMVLAASLGARLGIMTVVAYLLEGAAGLPVFTSTPPQMAGLAYFMGPTTGFLLGFLVLAAVIGLAADRRWTNSVGRLLAATLVAEIVTFSFGFAWLAWGMPLPGGASGIGVSAAFSGGILPFLLSEALKIGILAVSVPMTRRLIDRRT